LNQTARPTGALSRASVVKYHARDLGKPKRSGGTRAPQLNAVRCAGGNSRCDQQHTTLPMIDRDAIHNRLSATPWFTAERTSEGSRILLRGRRLEREHYGSQLYPTVVTIEHRYELQRTDGLPTHEQHSQHSEIFLKLVDAIETSQIGIHVFADTTRGLIREWIYVNNLPMISRLRTEHLQGHGVYELCYEDDPAWSFLDAAICQIRGTDWASRPNE
jgi:hypothetical protein